MLLYNITAKIDWRIQEAWLAWMLNTHIPEVLGTGCFSGHKFYHLLEVDEEDGPTYSIQYFAENRALYNSFISLYAQDFRKEEAENWGDQLLTFDTLMEVVN